MCRLSILLMSLVFFFSCKKSGPTGNGHPNDDSLPPAVTAIGIPVGSPVTKTIGSGGGTISSPDGRIELTIPAGALSVNTDISIQPTTDECPGGRGLAYDLLPNGTKFAVPVTYTFHYADSDMNGTSPYLYCLAYQDSLREWRANIFKDVDTVAKTIKFDILHFTAYVDVSQLIIVADRHDLYANEQTDLHYLESTHEELVAGETLPGQDELTLPVTHRVPDDQVKGWTVTGGAANGTISGSGSIVTYHAPSKIDKDRQVYVSGTFQQDIVSRTRSGSKIMLNKAICIVTLNLHALNLSFDLKMECNLSNTSNVYNDKYYDAASFHIEVKGKQVAVSDIVNQAPAVTPASGTGTDGTQARWIPDGIGAINLTGATGFIVDSIGHRLVSLTFTHTGTVLPTWQYTYTDGNTDTVDGLPIPGGLMGGQFDLDGSAQVYEYKLGTSGTATLTVTPKN